MCYLLLLRCLLLHFPEHLKIHLKFFCWCCCSTTQSCLTLCDPMDCSTPGFPVLRHLLELAQTHVHWVSDAIQVSRPLLFASPLAVNLSQLQGLLQWAISLHQEAKVLKLQHQSFQWIFMIYLLFFWTITEPQDRVKVKNILVIKLME